MGYAEARHEQTSAAVRRSGGTLNDTLADLGATGAPVFSTPLQNLRAAAALAETVQVEGVEDALNSQVRIQKLLRTAVEQQHHATSSQGKICSREAPSLRGGASSSRAITVDSSKPSRNSDQRREARDQRGRDNRDHRQGPRGDKRLAHEESGYPSGRRH